MDTAAFYGIKLTMKKRVINVTNTHKFFFLITVTFINFLFHLIWEYLQCSPLFIHLKTPPNSVSMIFATLGDIAIFWSAYLGVAILKKTFFWPWTTPAFINWIILIIFSMILAELIEYRAVQLQLWSYSLVNPTLNGVSVIPIFQMAIVNTFTILITKKLIETSNEREKTYDK
jgi:hypothetical protein